MNAALTLKTLIAHGFTLISIDSGTRLRFSRNGFVIIVINLRSYLYFNSFVYYPLTDLASLKRNYLKARGEELTLQQLKD